MILKHLEINSIKITPTKENNMVKLNYYNKMLKPFGFKLVMLIIIVSCPILISGKTFTIDSPGDLINQVDMDEVKNIVEIKLIGKINGTDILTMNKMVNLTSIDMSEATIVEGGMPYYETDNNRFGTQNNTLGEYWAYNLDLLTSVKLPGNLTTIGSRAFFNFDHLSELIIPYSVILIGSEAFRNCSALKSVTIGNSVTEIGGWAFFGCSALTSVTIGNSVTKIGSHTFSGCSSLYALAFSGSVRSIGSYVFSGCYNLTEITTINPIPPVIESNTFFGCTDTATLNVPDGSRNIYWIHPYWGQFKTINTTTESDAQFVADNITYYITSVELGTVEVSAANISSKSRAGVEVIIPKEVTYNNKKYIVAGIANNGFVGADISAITLPETINYVGLNAFKGCNNITSVTCLSLLPPSVDASSFDEPVYGKATLVINPSAESAYKNDEVWSKFYTISTTGIEDVKADKESAVRVEGGNIIAPEGSEVFDLSGRSVSVTGIRPGIYIVRIPGGRAVKVRL